MTCDYLGRQIKAGNYIVYPGRVGSALFQTLGRVVGVDENWAPYEGGRIQGRIKVRPDGSDRNVYITNYQNVVIVPDQAALESVAL